MEHKMNIRSRLASRSFIECLSLLAMLMVLSVGMAQEANAAVLFPIGDRPIAVSASANAETWGIDDQVDAQMADRLTVLSLATSPAELIRAVTISYRERTPVSRRAIFEVDHDVRGFAFTLTLQGRPGHGPLLLSVGPVKLAGRTPIMPLAPSPSSVLVFLPGLVGLLGVVLREQHRLTVSGSETESMAGPTPSGSAPCLVILSADTAFSKILHAQVSQAGYPARIAGDVNDILTLSEHTTPALLLVDRRVPDWDMLRTSPSLKSVPLISLAPAGSPCTEEQWMSDLDRGADGTYDYRDGGRLFLAKIRAYLRRAGFDMTRRGMYHVGAVELDADIHEVKVAGQRLQLSAKPFAILMALMQAPSKVFSRRELVDRVWGPQFAIGEHTLDVHVHALRRQLDRDPQRLCRLITVKGVGIKLKAADLVPPSLTSMMGRSACLTEGNKVEGSAAPVGMRPRYVGPTPSCQSHSTQPAVFRRVARWRPSRMPRRSTSMPDFGSAVLAR